MYYNMYLKSMKGINNNNKRKSMRKSKYTSGSIVIHNGSVWRILGRESSLVTSRRRYVLQNVLRPLNLKLGRSDKLHAVAIV